MIFDDLTGKGPRPTSPNDLNDPPRFAQPVETTKDAITLELQNYFDRNQLTASRFEELPTVRKYDLSTKKGESSQETATKLIQKFPSINEDLPLVAVLGATGRNFPMGIGTQYVHSVLGRATVINANSETYALTDGQTLTYTTTTPDGDSRDSVIVFRASRFVNIAQATAQEVVDEINFQALYAKAGVTFDKKVALGYGGPLDRSTAGDITITGGTALAALGFTIGQQQLFRNVIPYNRYHQSTHIDVAIEIVAQSYNERTELTDLTWSFFTFYMVERQSTFFGRTIFDNTISNETYQVIIKPDLSMSGEAEVPRPGDEINKLYVNRINIPMVTIQYIDRAVTFANTTTPIYTDPNRVTQDGTIPLKN